MLAAAANHHLFLAATQAADAVNLANGDLSKLFGDTGKLFSGPSLTATTLFCGLITGCIGWAAFSYGRKQGRVWPMILGIALMAYPYFIANAALMIAIGVILTVLLFVLRD